MGRGNSLQGLNFGGKRAEAMRARMKALRKPGAAAKLFNNQRPQDYPDAMKRED